MTPRKTFFRTSEPGPRSGAEDMGAERALRSGKMFFPWIPGGNVMLRLTALFMFGNGERCYVPRSLARSPSP